MKVQAIIPTAGTGKRFKTDKPKPLIELDGKPIFIHALLAFEQASSIDSVILVAQSDYMEEYERIVQQYALTKVSRIVVGGSSRFESVSNGLQVLDQDTQMVVIHDGVRPLVSIAIIEEAVKVCMKEKAVIVAVPVKPTIKRADIHERIVRETLKREELWEVQTPQVFYADILRKAHAQGKGSAATDDAMLVERLGVNVKIVEGSYRNVKITTQEDLLIAKAFLKEMHSEYKVV